MTYKNLCLSGNYIIVKNTQKNIFPLRETEIHPINFFQREEAPNKNFIGIC